MSTTSTVSIDATTERPGTLRARLSALPWLTVVPLAVVLAYADGFWVISLRGAVGSIQRTQEPFVSWLRDSTLVLPVFILAVLGALMLAKRWFGPVLRQFKTIVATSLLVVVAATLVGIAAFAASSAYDYSLQASEKPMAMTMTMPNTTAHNAADQHNKSALALQVRSVGYGSGILLATNLLLVPWVLALRGGRLAISKSRP